MSDTEHLHACVNEKTLIQSQLRKRLSRLTIRSILNLFRLPNIISPSSSSSSSSATNGRTNKRDRPKHHVDIPDGLYLGNGVVTPSSALAPQAVYDGGYDSPTADIRVRVANGGAGQSGLVKAFADAFIKDRVASGVPPFKVAWYLGDTTESLGLLAEGSVDVALTYNEAAEKQSVNIGAAVDRRYAFRDHFMLVGPRSNPARCDPNDDILAMFNKIVQSGNADVVKPPSDRPPTRFLSRFDKSATNIKESQLFITIGQVPWGLAYYKWYHQYLRFPLEALEAAQLLSEYTLTDRGSWLSSPVSVRGGLRIFKAGLDSDSDLLLNPAHLLLGAKANPENLELSREFMEWVVRDDGGQKVVAEFKRGGEILYSRAP